MSAQTSHPHIPTILVVEDEPALRLLVSEVLEEDGGFVLLVARSAEEAFEVLARNHDIDCVFTDVSMPGKCDGVDLTRGILQNYPDTKVVITSSNGYAGSPVDGVPFVSKPYDLINIPALLRNAIAV